MVVSMACSGGKGVPSLLTSPTPPPGATEIRVSGCSPEQLRWRPRSEQGGKVGAQYFQPRESRIPLGYLQPQHSSARAGAGLTTFPTRPPPEVRFTLARRPRQPESQRWKGYCPRGGWGGVVSPIPGPSRLLHRSQPLHRFLPLETRFFWSKGALGCHSSQGDPADREGGDTGSAIHESLLSSACWGTRVGPPFVD